MPRHPEWIDQDLLVALHFEIGECGLNVEVFVFLRENDRILSVNNLRHDFRFKTTSKKKMLLVKANLPETISRSLFWI